MSKTIQDVIDLARKDLNDIKKTRYTDVILVEYFNDYIQQSILNRPDLFLGKLNNLPESDLALEDDFPLADQYIGSAQKYIIGRAHMINTETTAIDRAGAYLTLAKQEGGIS